jgi:uncharacterized protein YyaL (SSP411 family)
MKRAPSAFYNWGSAYLSQTNDHFNIVIAGSNARKMVREFHTHYLPNAIFAGSESPSDKPLFKDRHIKDKTMIYVCSGNACKLPVENSADALKLME